MVKLNVLTIAIILIVAVLLIFGISLLSKPAKTVAKPLNTSVNEYKCTADSDCVAILGKTLKQCITAYCTSGICKTRVTQNCCGNNISEEIEDGLPGNKCTCPKDYGVCEPTVKYKDVSNKLVAAKYIARECIDNECKLVYVDAMQRDSEFFNIWNGAGFKMNIYVRYSNPFYEDNNIMEIEMKLADYDPLLLAPPITINEIRLMEGTRIVSRISPDSKIVNITQSIIHDVAVSYYDFIYPEELKTITLSIDYEYVPLRKVTTGTGVNQVVSYDPQPIERKIYTVTLSERLTFLDKNVIQE